MNREMAIEVEDLSYTYSDGTRALDKVSFSLAEGQSLALLGPNGSGQVHTAASLNGLLRVGEG